MRESIGGSMLLYLIIIFITAIILLFSSILTYSKAYKIKNRIVEIIEKYGTYDEAIDNMITTEINPDLAAAGYNVNKPTNCGNVLTNLTTGANAKYSNLSGNLNTTYGYNYCIFKQENLNEGHAYVVVTFVEFQVPIIGDFLSIPVYSEPKILGKKYNY